MHLFVNTGALFDFAAHHPGRALGRAALLLCALAVGSSAFAAPAAHWVASWSAPADQAGPAMKAQTLRQIVRTSIGGTALRLRLSNLYGDAPLTIADVQLATSAGGSATVPGSARAARFGGQAQVTIPVGQSVLSDPITMPVAPLQALAVSLYLPQGSGLSTVHGVGMQTVYLSQGADASAASTFPSGETDDSRYFLTDIEVAAAPGARALVALGDSITDGVGSSMERNGRWTDALAERLQRDPALADIGVVNSGIAGNRILNDASELFFGPGALTRLERDALDKAGARWVILLEGVNDITAAGLLSAPEDRVTAQQIIDGMRSAVARAHARGLKIWGATLLPRGGAAGSRPHTAAAEAMRLAVNAWIRAGGAFDAVLDFEQVLRDPARPERLLSAYDSGDHTHPNDAGYAAMAAAIDTHLFVEAK